MQPGHYTELFFLDEATALAAGHRPCSECRRERYIEYQDAWAQVFGLTKRPTAKDIDLQFKRDRSERRGNVVSDLNAIPDGAIVQASKAGDFYLVRDGRLHRWTFDGYGPSAVACRCRLPVNHWSRRSATSGSWRAATCQRFTLRWIREWWTLRNYNGVSASVFACADMTVPTETTDHCHRVCRRQAPQSAAQGPRGLALYQPSDRTGQPAAQRGRHRGSTGACGCGPA